MLDLSSAKNHAIAWARLGYRLFHETLDEYTKDRAELAAAGLAFFTLLSIAPLILIAVAIAGAVLRHGSARDAALSMVEDTMGSVAAKTVGGWVEQASASSGVASVVGFAFVLYAASRLTAQLRVALNLVWNVDRTAGSLMVVLLWLYFSAQMFLFGAEFTQVYARHFGSPQERR